MLSIGAKRNFFLNSLQMIATVLQWMPSVKLPKHYVSQNIIKCNLHGQISFYILLTKVFTNDFMAELIISKLCQGIWNANSSTDNCFLNIVQYIRTR